MQDPFHALRKTIRARGRHMRNQFVQQTGPGTRPQPSTDLTTLDNAGDIWTAYQNKPCSYDVAVQAIDCLGAIGDADSAKMINHVVCDYERRAMPDDAGKRELRQKARQTLMPMGSVAVAVLAEKIGLSQHVRNGDVQAGDAVCEDIAALRDIAIQHNVGARMPILRKALYYSNELYQEDNPETVAFAIDALTEIELAGVEEEDNGSGYAVRSEDFLHQIASSLYPIGLKDDVSAHILNSLGQIGSRRAVKAISKLHDDYPDAFTENAYDACEQVVRANAPGTRHAVIFLQKHRSPDKVLQGWLSSREDSKTPRDDEEFVRLGGWLSRKIFERFDAYNLDEMERPLAVLGQYEAAIGKNPDDNNSLRSVFADCVNHRYAELIRRAEVVHALRRREKASEPKPN